MPSYPPKAAMRYIASRLLLHGQDGAVFVYSLNEATSIFSFRMMPAYTDRYGKAWVWIRAKNANFLLCDDQQTVIEAFKEAVIANVTQGLEAIRCSPEELLAMAALEEKKSLSC